MRFLISRLSALGDVVCSLPAAAALKAGHPGCEVVWVCDRRFAAIPRLCSAVDRVVVGPLRWAKPGEIAQELGRFDAALDLQGLLKSAVVVGLSQARAKLAYHWQREGSRLFAAPVQPDPTSNHVVDQYVDVARAAGGVMDRADFALRPDEESLASVEDTLRTEGHDGRPLVVLNAGAGWATKRWPPRAFAELARRVTEAGWAVAFMGGPGDRETFAEVQAHNPGQVLDLVGRTSIPELVALLSLAQVHVAGDTGSAHIAAALGRPCVGLYTLTRPERSCPYGQFDRCLTGPPDSIPVEAVFGKVEEALKEAGT